MNIALIEDDKNLHFAIKNLLELEKYKTYSFYSIKEFLKNDKNFDIVIADISLPDGNFLEELKKHPSIKKNSKFIVISGYTEIENIKKAFNLGAVDFIKKPFDIEELILRIERFSKKEDYIKIKENFLFYPKEYIIKFNDEIINLTEKETKLFELLLHKKTFVTFEEIENYVWDEPITPNTLAATVKRLRKKLPKKDMIVSKRNLGYKFVIP